jgi:TonB family protein
LPTPPLATPTENKSRRGKTAAVAVAALVLAAAIGLVVRGGFPKTVTPPPAASPSASATEVAATELPSPPPVSVESEPSGGAVFLDDKEVGKTPVELAVAAGEHVVRVTHEGFSSGQLQITVAADGHPQLRFELDPVTAALSIHSEPSGARAAIDGREVGTTPVEKLAVYPGAHRITVGLAGYSAWTDSFEATAGKPVELVAHLKPVPRKQAKAAVAQTPEATPPPPVREGDLVALGPDVTPPRKVSGKSAFYPSAALAKKLEGKVMVELLVTETGEPKDLKVVQSAGPLLDDVVLDAIRSWRYEPAVKNGVKVRVVIREAQSFELRAPK